MAGYKPKRTLYRLKFENPDLAGLEVTTKGLSVDGLVRFIGLFEEAEAAQKAEAAQDGGKDDINPEYVRLLGDLFARFASVLVEWNIEDDDDQPVPRTAEGLRSLELDFVMQLMEAWITGMTQAPPPLPGGSSSGGTSPEVPPGLAGASQSLPSSSAPS